MFLGLPIPNHKKQAIARMQVHTDWEIYWQFSHVPEGLYKHTKHTSYFKIREYENEQNVRTITVKDYICEDLDGLVDRTLNTWREKL